MSYDIPSNPNNIRFCGGGRMVTPPPTTSGCLPHTPHPEGYVAHSEWAHRMLRTHVQQRCPGCGLWMIWKPKP